MNQFISLTGLKITYDRLQDKPSKILGHVLKITSLKIDYLKQCFLVGLWVNAFRNEFEFDNSKAYIVPLDRSPADKVWEPS